jgi:hypothetical protein
MGTLSRRLNTGNFALPLPRLCARRFIQLRGALFFFFFFDRIYITLNMVRTQNTSAKGLYRSLSIINYF